MQQLHHRNLFVQIMAYIEPKKGNLYSGYIQLMHSTSVAVHFQLKSTASVHACTVANGREYKDLIATATELIAYIRRRGATVHHKC